MNPLVSKFTVKHLGPFCIFIEHVEPTPMIKIVYYNYWKYGDLDL